MDLRTSTYFLFVNLVLIHLLNPCTVKGDYRLRVQVSGYSNPSNTCAECEGRCCDSNDAADCDGNERCDNVFFYCLMPLQSIPLTSTIFQTAPRGNTVNPATRALLLGCLQPSTARRSGRNNNGAVINFLSSSVLGLPNPLGFEVTADRWQGITLYVDVLDDNGGPNERLIDVFLVDIWPRNLVPGANMTMARNYGGTFGIATIELSFQLECLPGFIGEDCLDSSINCDSVPCNNGGICDDTMNGFTCTCRGDFTGNTCDIMVNDCLNVNCNNGTCVDGIRSFICECEVGYTGQFCDQRVAITETTPTGEVIETTDLIRTTGLIPTASSNTDSTDISISGMVGIVTGAVVGGVLFILLIIIAVVVLLLLLKKRNIPKATQSKDHPMVNPIYDATGLPTLDIGSEPERDWDNPIYGLGDSDSTAGMIDHQDVVYSRIDT